MKKYETEDGYVVVGTAREIKSLETNVRNRDDLLPVFTDSAHYDMGKFYGLSVDSTDSSFTIVGEHTLAKYLV